MQTQVHTHATAGMAERKDEMWSNEEGPVPAPFSWYRVASKGDVELPQGPANAAQDCEHAQEQGNAKSQLHHERQVAKEGEVRQYHIFQQSLIEAKRRMLSLRPEPVGQPTKALPLGIHDPGCLLQRRMQPPNTEHDAQSPDRKSR